MLNFKIYSFGQFRAPKTWFRAGHFGEARNPARNLDARNLAHPGPEFECRLPFRLECCLFTRRGLFVASDHRGEISATLVKFTLDAYIKQKFYCTNTLGFDS